MTDHDKLRLIDYMIADYYEFSSLNTRTLTAEGVISAICSVLDFDREEIDET